MNTTRERLYQEIWNEAITKVAVKYGVSDNGIRKKCRAYNIPTPDNRYWGLLHAGKNPTPKPLPTFSGDSNITFQPSYKPGQPPIKEPPPPKIIFEDFSQLEREKLIKIYNALEVKNQLRTPHPMISEHQRVVKLIKHENRKNPYFIFINMQGMHGQYGHPAIINTDSVSEEQFPRLYLFLNALFYALENVGAKITVHKYSHPTIILQGYEITFYIKEKYKKSMVPQESNRNASQSNRNSYLPAGLLVFKLRAKSPRCYNEVHREWEESKSRKLSDYIKDIFESIVGIPKVLHQYELAYLRRLEEERLQAERRTQAKKLHDDELTRVKELVSDARLLHLSKQLDEYIALWEAVDSVDDETIKWAKEKAKWLNPFDNQKDGLLTEEDKRKLVTDNG